MTEATARDLARYITDVLGRAYCLCRSKMKPDEWQVLTEEAVREWKGEWSLSGWEVVETHRPDGTVEEEKA